MLWLIIAFIFPIPIFHLWLHGLLPFWRKFPFIYYVVVGAIWICSFLFFREIIPASPQLFEPNRVTIHLGDSMVFLGFLAALGSLITIGPKRFFMYAVLRPEKVKQKRITKWVFKNCPHPAYNGYIFATFGALIYTGNAVVALVFIFLLTTTPIVMWLESNELDERVKGR
ncbi:hypothetical protein HOM98_00040 [Candidatus Peregrinibacteria bacterium]|jgi:hypothetical protein|nr:hypothetical protein [Candidatus Peregrinibacteria bacterium]MBT7484491.1 hypothetical protein [Candidatus Peregrinibacteria bacterium]